MCTCVCVYFFMGVSFKSIIPKVKVRSVFPPMCDQPDVGSCFLCTGKPFRIFVGCFLSLVESFVLFLTCRDLIVSSVNITLPCSEVKLFTKDRLMKTSIQLVFCTSQLTKKFFFFLLRSQTESWQFLNNILYHSQNHTLFTDHAFLSLAAESCQLKTDMLSYICQCVLEVKIK